MVSGAQSKNKKETVKVHFYGIDFSAVNVKCAAETEERLMAAFVKINQLLVLEQNKYNVGAFLKLEVLSLQVDHAIDQIDKLKGMKFKDIRDSKISLAEIIESYPTEQDNILLIVAKKLSKCEGTGVFIAVIFNGETKQVIPEQEFSGEAGGFGLRNFWAGALYDGLKRARYQ